MTYGHFNHQPLYQHPNSPPPLDYAKYTTILKRGPSKCKQPELFDEAMQVVYQETRRAAAVGAIYQIDYCEESKKVKLFVWPEEQVLPEWCTTEVVVQIVEEPGEALDGYCYDV